MKKKKILIIIFIVLALLLIGGGITYSLYTKTPPKEEKKPTGKNNKEDSLVAELKGIATSDKKIRLSRTDVYRCDGISGMMLYITPYDNFEKIYLKIIMELPKKKEEIIIKLENLVKDTAMQYEVQSLNDWTGVKSWTVEIITEQEAIAAGYTQAES